MPGRLDQHQAYKELGAKIWARMGSLRSEMLRLLKEDEEFRYAVAGLIGLEEILKRLDRHEAQLVKLREDMNRLREDMNRGFRRYDEELARLREDMNKGFELPQAHRRPWGQVGPLSRGILQGWHGGRGGALLRRPGGALDALR